MQFLVCTLSKILVPHTCLVTVPVIPVNCAFFGILNACLLLQFFVGLLAYADQIAALRFGLEDRKSH